MKTVKRLTIKKIGNWELQLQLTKETDSIIFESDLMVYCALNNTIVKLQEMLNYTVLGRKLPKKFLTYIILNYSKFTVLRDALSAYDSLSYYIQNYTDLDLIKTAQYTFNHFLGKVDMTLSPTLIHGQYIIYNAQRQF